MNFAVTLLLFRPNAPYTQILSISRGDDLNDWGLVGGKVESAESLRLAIMREAREEAHVLFPDDTLRHTHDLVPVYTGIAKTRLTTTFLSMNAMVPHELPQGREGKVQWKTPHHLISRRCTYHEYNFKLFEHLRLPTAFQGNPSND